MVPIKPLNACGITINSVTEAFLQLNTIKEEIEIFLRNIKINRCTICMYVFMRLAIYR